MDDKKLIDQLLGLWIGCLVNNPELFEYIIQMENKQEESEKSTIVEILI